MFPHSIWIKKKCCKFCNFNAICKYNVAIECITVQQEKGPLQSNLTGYTTLVINITSYRKIHLILFYIRFSVFQTVSPWLNYITNSRIKNIIGFSLHGETRRNCILLKACHMPLTVADLWRYYDTIQRATRKKPLKIDGCGNNCKLSSRKKYIYNSGNKNEYVFKISPDV
jgi:hypothetical protein